MVIVDIHKEIGAVKEAIVAKVQTIGICDSNSDPLLIDYPIPMNDDANKAIEYVLDLIKEAIIDGNKAKPKLKAKEETQK
jgi:small subunit ribosomal protein S2